MHETQHGRCLLQAQQHCNAVQPEQRAAHVRELVRSLAEWAEAHKALNAVIQLPMNPLEEQVRTAANATPGTRAMVAQGNQHCMQSARYASWSMCATPEVRGAWSQGVHTGMTSDSAEADWQAK